MRAATLTRPFRFVERTFWLYVKLSIVLVPTFLLFATVGLVWLSDRIALQSQETLALRIGNSAARIGGALERFGDRQDDLPDWSHPHVRELMQTLLSDPAVRCVELEADRSGALLATAPQGIGCTEQDIDHTIEYEVFSEPISLLKLHYHTGELREARVHQREFSIALLVGGLIVAMLTNWLSFSIIIGRPLTAMITRLERAKKSAEAANAAKSDFLAKMSHEIRTPMNGVVGMADLLSETRLDDTQASFVRTISGSADALLKIINDILDFSKVEAGKLELARAPYSLKDTAFQVTELLRPLAQDKGLALSLDIDPGLPDVISGDGGRMRQVLLNVIGNAIKFTPDGWVKVTLDRDGDGAAIRISDSGIGIPEAKLDAIFSAFEQVNNARNRQFDGTGLGLAISRQLVQLMEGEIAVTSTEGAGTEFTITLPLDRVDQTVATDSPDALDSKRISAGWARGRRILVVDDNATNRLVIKRYMQDSGAEVTFATNGQDAVDQYKANPAPYILMDVSMPIMNGLRATELIRMIEGKSGAAPSQIIALTANAHQSDRDAAEAAGMNGFLTKPLRKGELITTLMRHFGQAAPTGQTP